MLFTKPITITCPRGSSVRRGTFNAEVVDDGFADSFDETKANTQIREITVFVRIADWSQFSLELPRIGDRIKMECGDEYSVFSSSEVGGRVFSMRARKC